MARKTRCGIDPAVDRVLGEIVSPVGDAPLGRILELIARLDFFFMRVAIGTEGLDVAQVAELSPLCCVELVARGKIRRMIERGPIVLMTVAAVRGNRDLDRMPLYKTPLLSACVRTRDESC
jgi:hypothetical protein